MAVVFSLPRCLEILQFSEIHFQRLARMIRRFILIFSFYLTLSASNKVDSKALEPNPELRTRTTPNLSVPSSATSEKSLLGEMTRIRPTTSLCDSGCPSDSESDWLVYLWRYIAHIVIIVYG